MDLVGWICSERGFKSDLAAQVYFDHIGQEYSELMFVLA
jgi:hypothetical protein